jgi:hypothetical protein
MSLVGPFVHYLLLLQWYAQGASGLSSCFSCVECYLLGHIPAWLHAAACHGPRHFAHTEFSQYQASVIDSRCDHCHSGCHSKTVKSGLKKQERPSSAPRGWFEDDRHHDSHDEDHCVVCQSLVGFALAVSLHDSVRLPPDLCSYRVFKGSDGLRAAEQFLVQQPRGPPAV